MDGVYCKTKLRQLLIEDQRLDFIPKELFGVIVSYAADERFVRPCYTNQKIISVDRDGAFYEATVIQSVGPTHAEVHYHGWVARYNEVIDSTSLNLPTTATSIGSQSQILVAAFLKSSVVVGVEEENFRSILDMIRDSKKSKTMTGVGRYDPRTVILHDILRFPNDQVMLRLEIEYNLSSQITSAGFLWIALTDVIASS